MMTTRCPKCNSTQVSVEVSGLTARLVCKACSYKGLRYKATSKDDIPLISELVERSAMTFLEVDDASSDMLIGNIADALSDMKDRLCSELSCDTCPFRNTEELRSSPWFGTLGLVCDSALGATSKLCFDAISARYREILASERENS